MEKSPKRRTRTEQRPAKARRASWQACATGNNLKHRPKKLEDAGFVYQPSGVWLHLDGRGIGNGVAMALSPEAFEGYLTKPSTVVSIMAESPNPQKEAPEFIMPGVMKRFILKGTDDYYFNRISQR